jgi:hypothetical protein
MNNVKNDSWVWVIIQDPEGDEQFLGQTDEENNISFVPFFLKKEEAELCISGLTKKPGHKYEIQAILFEEIKLFCSKENVMLFLLNGAGEILEKIQPS